jgi:hypothetical protein
MTRSSAIRRLMASPAVKEAPPVVKDWLRTILRHGQGKEGGRRAEASGETSVRSGKPGR